MRTGTSIPRALAVLGLVLLPACGGGGTGSTSDTDAGTTTATSGTTTTTGDPTTTAPTTGPGTSSTTDVDTTTTGPTTGTSETTDTTTDTTGTSTGSTTGDMGTLCERLGGEAGVAELVVAALDLVLADDRVNGYFLNSDVDAAGIGTCLVKQVGALAECPGVVYDCQDMQAAHAGLGISTADFMDFAADFSTALDTHQAAHPTLTDTDKSDILTALGAMAPDIVEDADSNLTVYQRVGRKPAIRALVGGPGVVGTFLDNVGNDDAINGFFGLADVERLGTCLTRQIGGIDGPSKYGLEVDAPAAEPGVGVGNECRTMAASHTGLLDVKDNIGIDINDFGALVADLVAAMTAANVQPADQDAIVAALAPMCEDILAPQFKYQCPSASSDEAVEKFAINLPIPNDGYDGSLASMLCVDLDVADDGFNFVTGLDLTLAINHTWVGDLTIKLQSPDMTVLTVMSRPGLVEAADNGAGCCGDNSNLEAASPVTFTDAGASDAELMGTNLAGDGQVVCKDDAKCDWKPNPGAGVGVAFSDFFGAPTVGTWRACVADSGGADFGSLAAATLVLHKSKYDPTP